MTEIIFIVEDDPEGGFTCKALGLPIFTEAESFDELRKNIKEAVQCHFNDDIKRIIRIHYVREEIFAA